MLTREEFTRLAERYGDTVFRLAYGWLKNPADAEDAAQNALLRLYRADKAFESDEHVRNWLIRVTLNECRQLWRSPWRRTVPVEQYAETLAFEDARDGDLFRAIMALDRRYRSVIVLYYYEGYDIREIADMLRIPPGTVGTRLHRARGILKKFLTEAADDE